MSQSDHDAPMPDGERPGLASLQPPVVPAVIDPLDPLGLLRTGSQNHDLEVRVPVWPITAPAGESDVLELYWGSVAVPVASQAFPGPVDSGLFPFVMHVPKALLQVDGRFSLFYKVQGFTGVISESPPRTVTLDTRPPSYDKQLEALVLPVDLVDGVVDQAYLESHGDALELRVPTPLFLGVADGDVLSLFWSRSNPPDTSVLKTQTITQAQIDAQDIRVQVSTDELRDAGGDGRFFAVYKVRDRAGNEAPFSRETGVLVLLDPDAGDYLEPEFPDANIWGYYNCEHEPKVWEGVRVRIPLNTGFAVGDSIVLLWEGFRTLNGVDPIPGTKRVFEDKVRPDHLVNGFLDIRVQPYEGFLDLIEFGSATARYLRVNAGGQHGASRVNLVKIDRQLPGGGHCGPTRSAGVEGFISDDGAESK